MQKEKVLAVIGECPDELDVDALAEKLYLLQKLEDAESELSAGQGIPHDEVRRRFETWRTSSGHRER